MRNLTPKTIVAWLVISQALLVCSRETSGQTAANKIQTAQEGISQSPEAGQPGPSLEDLLRKMEATYQGIRTYQAEFDQETETKSLQRVKRSSGWIYVEKPDKVRWSYREPEAQEIYMLPGQVYVWLPDRNQVMKTSEAELGGMEQVRVLLAQGRLSESFAITLLPSDTGSQDFYRLRLVPKSGARISLEEMVLSVRKQDDLLAKTESRDLLGNVTKISFRNWDINAKLKKDLFHFEIPEGAEVLDEAL